MNALQALIFDVDGTLAETERDGHRPAFNAAFAEHGMNWVWDEVRYGRLLDITGGKERIRHYAGQFDPVTATRPDFDDLVKRLHAAKTAHYVRLVEHGRLPLRPGIARLIGEARAAGLRLAIATTTSPENVDALLRATLGEAAPGWFAVIGAGDVAPAKKPAPDIYHWVLERLRLPAATCLAIEDSENGLKSASTAGVRCLVTVNDYTRDQDFSDAWAVRENLAAVTLESVLADSPGNAMNGEPEFHRGRRRARQPGAIVADEVLALPGEASAAAVGHNGRYLPGRCDVTPDSK